MTDSTAELIESPADEHAAPPASAGVRSVARNAAALALATVVSRGTFFVWQLVLNRLLTPAEYGIYGTIGGMLNIATIMAEFGIGVIVVRDVARQLDRSGSVLSATIIIQPITGTIVYIALLITGHLLGYTATITSLLPLAGIALFTDLLGTMVHSQLIAHDRMVIPSLISIAHVYILLTLIALALMGGLGLRGLYGATIAASLLRAIMYWVAGIRNGIHLSWPPGWKLSWGLIRDGGPLALNAAVSNAGQHIDKILMTAIAGAEYTAYLLAAFIVVFGVVELLNFTVLVAVLPLMSRQYAQGEHKAFAFLVEKIVFLTLVLTVPIGVILSIMAPVVVGVLFRQGYTLTADILSVLIWYAVLLMMGNIFGQVLTIQNRQNRLIVIRGVGLLLTVGLMIILLPAMGPVGVAVSSVLSESVVTVLLFWQWEERGRFLRRVGPRLLRLSGAGIVMALLLLGLHRLTSGETTSLLLAALSIVVSVVSYGAVVWWGGIIAPDDRGFIRQVLISMPGGGIIARLWPQTAPVLPEQAE